jgi:mRNA interferase YafQ
MKDLIHSTQFKKDFKRVSKRGWNIEKLFNIVELLRKNKILDKKYKAHKLNGDYKEFTECHLEPDWLLIYKDNDNLITLYRTGSHSDLF